LYWPIGIYASCSDLGAPLTGARFGVIGSESRAALQLENVALRYQIGVLQRPTKKRLPLNDADRLLWIGLCRVWTEWRSALKILKPDTVIGWHRKTETTRVRQFVA
jgi:hypothetical protein